MKKILICALLLALCLLSGCKGKTPPDSTGTDNLTTTAPAPGSGTSPTGTAPAETLPAQPADGVLDCKKSGDSLTIAVTLAECAGQEVSILALSDAKYQYSWPEHPDALAGIAQITLDGEGKGGFTLTLKSANDPVCVILTASTGSYISEVK